jgi:hypothetical protein
MVFDSLDFWVRVLDLPMDMMNRVYGELIGGWIGRFISADVDEEGMAWGKDLRIRVEVNMEQPLLRGVPLKESDDDADGKWFDLKYEKVLHFCFDCGRLVHSDGGCLAKKEEVQQWGKWLRASPQRGYKSPPPARPSVSSRSYSSRSHGSDARFREGPSVHDLPTKRNLAANFSLFLSSSRTGGNELRRENVEITSLDKRHGVRARDQYEGKMPVGTDPKIKKKGTYTRYERKWSNHHVRENINLPPGSQNRKRGTKQVWVQVPVKVLGEETSESSGKRQRTISVFDRLEDPTVDPARQGR